MVEWSCTKERINERGTYIFVKWSNTNKRNKSMGTLNSGRMVVCIALGKRVASHHPVFIGKCPKISHNLLLFSIQWMSSPLRKWRRWSVQDFILLFLCLVWIQRIKRQGDLKISLCNPNDGNFLRQSHNYYSAKHQRWISSAITANELNLMTV